MVCHNAQTVAAAVVVAADFGFDNQHLVGFEVVGAVFQRVAADHDFHQTAQIFKADEGDFAAFAHHGAHSGNESGEAYAVLRFQTAQFGRGDLADFLGIRAERVAGQVKADDGFFFGEFFRFAPHGRVDELHRFNGVFHHVEKSALIDVGGFLVGVAHGKVDVRQEHGAVGLDAVERAAAY